MPRLGFAYRPFGNDKWAVRGGVGLYNINMLGSSFYSLTGTVQAYTQQFSNTYNPTTHAIGYQWPQIYAGAGSAGSAAPAYGTDYFGTANSTNWKDPYTEQWSLSVDHDLGSGYAARISYIGSETHQLVWAPDENTLPYSNTVSAFNNAISTRLFPNWGRINTRATGANESYHSLQAEASHRLQHGLEYHSGFTWAKNLADNQGPDNTGLAAKAAERVPPRSWTVTSTSATWAERADCAGTRRLLYDLPVAAARCWALTCRARLTWWWADGGCPPSSPCRPAHIDAILPHGQGDPSGTGSGWMGPLATEPAASIRGAPQPARGLGSRRQRQSPGKNRFNWTNAAAFACPGDTSWTVGNPCTTGAGFNPQPAPRCSAHPLPIGRFGNARSARSLEGPGLVNLSSGLSKTFSHHRALQGEGGRHVHQRAQPHQPGRSQPEPEFGSASASGLPTRSGSDFGGARTGPDFRCGPSSKPHSGHGNINMSDCIVVNPEVFSASANLRYEPAQIR
jgi:hypothetical protein